jgi:DNA replication protein
MMMDKKKFAGFPEGEVHLVPIPTQFFSQLLPAIDSMAELKVSLYAIYRLDRGEGAFRYLRISDFEADQDFMRGLAKSTEAASARLKEGLKRAVARGVLLGAAVTLGEEQENLYFLNSPRGRAAVEAIARGEWRPSGDPHNPVELLQQPPNIYRLYEEHIGPLTPMIAETLRDAEATYSPHWIEEAIRIAVENNVRRWAYVEAILQRWHQEGRHEQKDRRDTQKARRRYVQGEFSDFIEH